MLLKRLILALIFLYFLLPDAEAQEINGFKVFVTKEQYTSIEFHSEIDNLAFNPKHTPYKVEFMGTKTIFLETPQEVKESYDLLIQEGGRSHKFYVIYADDVDPSKRDNDYSNLNQLKVLIKNFVADAPVPQAQAASNKQTTITDNTKVNSGNNNDKVINNAGANSPANINFYMLIDEADKAKKGKQFQEAKAKYEQALQLQPDNGYTKAQLQEVNEIINNESNAKYDDAVTKAKQASDSKNYDEAVKYLNAALEIKPHDEYALSQLTNLQKKQATAIADEINLQKENLYASYLKAGDKAFADKSYEAAQTAYAEALKIKPNDAKALSKINAAGKQKISDSTEAVHQKAENLFLGFVNAGDKAFEEKHYAASRLSYIEAQKLKPGDVQLKSKINSIDQKLYTGFLDAGAEALTKKSYDEAKDAFNEALKLKPNDAVALGKLKAVDKQKTQDEAEDRFKNYVITGDKAIHEKSYPVAGIAYTEALKIKPNDASVKTKLDSIKELIINDSLESKRKKDEDLYAGFIATGNQALGEKLYDEAKVSFSQALKIKPGDVAANEKINIINDELFKNFLNNGDIALLNKQYNRAADAYNEALKLKPNDADAKEKLAQIEKNKTQDKLNDTYTSYIQAGDKALANKSYTEARMSYNYALNVMPEDSAAKNKLQFLNNQIAADSLQTIAQKNEASFKELINAAQEAVLGQNYAAAISAYTAALKIKPGNADVILAISNTQKLMEQSKTDSLITANKRNNEATDSVISKIATKTEELAAHEIDLGMLLVKARLFKMGSDVGSTDESPLHTVKFDSFYISRFEVTQSQWQRIMGNNPSFFKDCDDCPVENVSWNDVMNFINKLNQLTGKNYRLPTEAEWEYVAGTQNKKENIDNIAWYNDNAKNKTHHIGLLQPNFLGVYDMYGNVSEWCSDWYNFSSYKKNMAVNPLGPASGKEKVVRGGNWYDMEGAFRVSVRDKTSPGKANKRIGFRLAMSIN